MDTDGKRALARDWLSKWKQGSVRVFLSQTVTQECQSTGGKISGYVGAAVVARLTGLSPLGLPPKELQSTLEAEIKQNQDLHTQRRCAEAWGLNKRSIEAASGSDSKIQRVEEVGPPNVVEELPPPNPVAAALCQRAELLWVGGS